MLLHRALAVVTTLLLFVSFGRCADLDRYLPEDTEFVLNINVRQLLNSELVKKHLRTVAHQLLASELERAVLVCRAADLKDLGFDPFKDLDCLVVTAPAPSPGEKDYGLVIAHGRFDVAKFRANAEEVSKGESDHLKIRKVLGGKHILYEVSCPDRDEPVFVAIPDSETILSSINKDYVVDAIKKSGKGARASLKNKKFQALMEKVEAHQSLSLALGAVVIKDLANDKTPGDIKNMMDKIQALIGGLTISDEIKLEVAVTAEKTQDAKELSDSAKAGLINQLLGFAAPVAQNGDLPGAELVVDIIKSLRVTNKAETVFIKGRISSDLIEDALKKKEK